MQTNSLYITEGGNARKGSNRIPAEMSMSIYNQAVSMLKLSYPDSECLPLGSTGRKGRGETNGDIDIGVALPCVGFLLKWVKANTLVMAASTDR